MQRWKHRLLLLTGIGIIIAGFGILSIFELNSFPNTLRLIPGQKMTLSVHYPFGLAMVPEKSAKPKKLSSTKIQGSESIIANNLVIQSKQVRQFDVQLRLFGAIPVKKLHVQVLDPPQVVPGGQAIGVLFSSEGVIVVGHIPVKGMDGKLYYPARDAGVKTGDIILAINQIPIKRVEDVELILRNYQPGALTSARDALGGDLTLKIRRQDRIFLLKIKPVLTRGSGGEGDHRYLMGIFIEDPAAGVGTLTFYDPLTKKFAGLGHRISELAGAKGVTLNRGEIVLAEIHGIRAGVSGQPGEKIGVCDARFNSIGQIEKNTQFGIYGKLFNLVNDLSLLKPVPVAYSSQIRTGPAEIYTVLSGRRVEKFAIEILKVYRQTIPRDKGMVIKVIDPDLLKRTGGIIQGMSGSPIIQNGKLIGAVTHVFVNDPSKGYGVLAEWMMNEMNGA
ncbi:MAG TPA: SpoIVB peptidase [Bacillota bacterium]|nr:SpoIVB peptidase [Bacillota bacterium]